MADLKKFEYTMNSCNHCGQCKWILTPKMSGWDFERVSLAGGESMSFSYPDADVVVLMNNLTDEPNAFTGKHITSGMRNFNGAFHPITKTE